MQSQNHEFAQTPKVVWYRHHMARGFESKSVEAQQDAAQLEHAFRPELSPEERLQVQRRTTLELTVAQTQSELQAACRPVHREMLRLKLEALKAELGTM